MKKIQVFKAPLPRAFHVLFSVGVVAFLLVGAFLMAHPVRAAAPETCTTTADGDWSDAIWSCTLASTAPHLDSDVVILHEVTLSTDQEIAGLSIAVDSTNDLYGVLTFIAPVTLTLHGDFSLDEFAVFDPGNDYFEPVTPSTGGTVVFASGSQTISATGEVEFFDLRKVASGPGESLSVDPQAAGADGMVVLHSLTLQGVDEKTLLTLRSTTPGSQWGISSENLTDVNFVDVQDSNHYGLTPITVMVGQDSGNNSGWVFNPLNVMLATSGTPSNPGSAVTFTADVVPTDATGAVAFMDGLTAIEGCEAVALVNGSAACNTSLLTSVGEHSITAVFYGNGGYDGITSTSNEVLQMVTSLSTVTLTVSASPSNFGDAVTFIARITPASATGEVGFYLGNDHIESCKHQPITLVMGMPTASCTVSDLALGSHDVRAEYGGNTTILPSSSPVHVQEVKYAATVGIVSSMNPSVVGKPVTLTATVVRSAATPPGGTVTFKRGDVVISGCASVALVNGLATCVVNLPVGSYTLSATYSGAADTFAAASSNLPQVVEMAKYFFPSVQR